MHARSKKASMRGTSKDLPIPLPPPPQPLKPIISPHFCAPRALQLVVSRHCIIYPDGYTLEFTDPSNHDLLFKVDAPIRRPNSPIKRLLQDPLGTPLACTQRKLLSLITRWDAHRGNQCERKNRLFKVTKSSLFQQDKSSLDIYLDDPQTKQNQPEFRVNGSYLERPCAVMRGAETISQIKPSADNNAVIVTVNEGVDTAFIALLVVIMEELHREQSKAQRQADT